MQKSNFKKIIFFLTFASIFILFINTKASSQLEIGAKGGLSFNSINNQSFFFESENMSHNVFEKNNGYRVGFYTKIKLLKSLFIQPEIYYSSVSKKYDLTFPLDHENFVVDKLKKNRIIVPILIGVDLFDRFSLFGGPNFNFNDRIFFNKNNQNITLENLYDMSEVYLNYGLSVKFKKLIIDLRFERGFDKKEIKVVDVIVDDVDQIVKSNDLLTIITLGYKF
tara:strand:+ start:413 stop:1081 length:669 start_codon:yes stop_codon:yes gene_type:complete